MLENALVKISIQGYVLELYWFHFVATYLSLGVLTYFSMFFCFFQNKTLLEYKQIESIKFRNDKVMLFQGIRIFFVSVPLIIFEFVFAFCVIVPSWPIYLTSFNSFNNNT